MKDKFNEEKVGKPRIHDDTYPYHKILWIKLYANLSDVSRHPIKYFKWRRYALKVWKQGNNSECESFRWYVKSCLQRRTG